MLRRIAVIATVALSAVAFTSVASAGGNSENARTAAECVQAGVGTLVSLGLIDEAARGQLDYFPLGSQPGGAGLINVEFESGPVYIPLKDVIALHRSDPRLFDWCL